jgi:hypothetical protein
MVVSFTDLPPELWDKIVQLACTDGGKTGCALSLVSRRVRELSHLFRLQSIALLKPVQMEQFHEQLKNRPNNERCLWYMFIDRNSHGHGHGAVWPAEVWVEVLSMIAPGVRALTITHRNIDTWTIPSLTFPFLKSLAITVATFRDSDFAFPCLRHLHLYPNTQRDDKPLYRIIAARVPSLTHLRLSGMIQEVGLAHQWGAVLGIPYHIQELTKREAKLREWLLKGRGEAPPRYNEGPVRLPHLQALIFRPGAIGESEGWGNAFIAYDEMIRGLTQLSLHAPIRTPNHSNIVHPKVVVLPGNLSDAIAEELRRDWDNVVSGGLGAWEVTSSSVKLE